MTKKINYKLVPLWISIEKLTFKPKYELVPFWNEINLFINDLEYKKSEDFLLYRKINTFLCNGPAGTLYIIKKALGMQKLKVFISFLLDYINNESTPGHYFPSYVVLNQIEQIKTISNLIDFDSTLNEISKIMHENHGDKNAKGWQSSEMLVEKRKDLLTRKKLAQALEMSQTTLWRVLKDHQAIAKKYKLKPCPTYRNYAGGRKYYLAEEVQAWLNYVDSFNLKQKS